MCTRSHISEGGVHDLVGVHEGENDIVVVTDALTTLFNRHFLDNFVKRLLAILVSRCTHSVPPAGRRYPRRRRNRSPAKLGHRCCRGAGDARRRGLGRQAVPGQAERTSDATTNGVRA